jgi:adenosylhomocysteine nucleosidase
MTRYSGPWSGSGPTDMSRVAIVAALEREVRPLVKTWHVSEREHGGRRFRFFEHGDAVLLCGGIGGEAARRAAEGVIAIFEPAVVYSVGFAGALDSSLKVGDIVRPKRVVNARDGSSVGLDGGDGVLVTFPSVASPEQKTKLRESYGAQAVDMEAAAVARAAELRGVTFGVIKAISDEVDFEFPSTEQFIDSSGGFSEGRFAWFAVMRPWLWGRVIELAQNSGRASRALCATIEALIATKNAPVQAQRASETARR